jgi:hypothetical protein
MLHSHSLSADSSAVLVKEVLATDHAQTTHNTSRRPDRRQLTESSDVRNDSK